MKIVQIGNGKIAQIHRRCLGAIAGLVVRNVEKHRKKARNDATFPKDAFIVSSVNEAHELAGNGVIWDVVSDDHTHYDYARQILSLDPAACIMVAKTPYHPDKIRKFEQLLSKHPSSRFTITENYTDSAVVEEIKSLIGRYGLRDYEVSVEFTKNRAKDIEHGRFIHRDIDVLGYEGSHMISLLLGLGKKPASIKRVEFRDLDTSLGKLKRQGSALVEFAATDGTPLRLYTSMDGILRENIENLSYPDVIGHGSELRYRIVSVHDKKNGIVIVGQFDPVEGMERFHGRILVLKNGEIIHGKSLPDHTMLRTLKKQVDYMLGSEKENPFPIEKAWNYRLLYDAYYF